MRTLIASACLLACAGVTQAETLAVCGPYTGTAYYVAGGLVKGDDAGWQPDQSANARTTLSRDDKGEYDILFGDASGGVYSSLAEGGSVIAIRMEPDDMAVLVAYPGKTAEIYQFSRSSTGEDEMLLLQSKGAPIRKGAVYRSVCSAVRYPEMDR